ncbi:MAG: glutamine synthetase family protein [Kiritimatiellae bacterium]|nr:glutamine synthetase family protein [Kiritimatiellia bacterium]
MNCSRSGFCTSPLTQEINKPARDFTRADIIRFVEKSGIEAINFRYVAGDGKLKTLNFVITSRAHLDELLSLGERVDGSSLFRHVDAAGSDLYVVPRFRTAYVNPFAQVPTLDILCSYFTKDGDPLPNAPEHLVARAHKVFRDATGYELEAMGELEYYIFYEQRGLYEARAQRGYHESMPFAKWEQLRVEAMKAMSQCNISVKYGHSEVGHINEACQGIEQGEVELLPVPLEDAADQIVIAKWILRMVGYKYGVNITFAPKIAIGHAGSGLHIHTRLVRNGRSAMLEEGRLSDAGRKVVAGYLALAPSLTAFGNTVPTSYLRLVPHQEAPTHVCWGDRNRSVLVRVPLAWTGIRNLSRVANPLEQEWGEAVDADSRQTIELRSPDGSANAHLLLAGLAVAARHGLEMEDALGLAEQLYVDVNIFHEEHKAVRQKLPSLPSSCWESAQQLLKDRTIYEKHSVFTPATINAVAEELMAHDDRDIQSRLVDDKGLLETLIRRHLHCG